MAPRALRRPPPVPAGARVAIAAPSGPYAPERLAAGAAVLESMGFEVQRPAEHRRQGYLAGDDAARAGELIELIEDPAIAAIFCARGGFGAMRILPQLDAVAGALATSPKPIVGFSDVTAIHAWAQSHAGIQSIHGPLLTTLPDTEDAVRQVLGAILSGERGPVVQGTSWVSGNARGPLVGGNLALICHLLGTPYSLEFDGAVLLLEDVGEAPYRLDRMWTQLRLAGVFERIAGIALGDFVNCDYAPGTPLPTAQAVLRELATATDLPTVAELPVGHRHPNHPLWLGGEVELDGDAGTLQPLA